jgi:hypothetical protein
VKVSDLYKWGSNTESVQSGETELNNLAAFLTETVLLLERNPSTFLQSSKYLPPSSKR